jgi:molybdate transport system ATP-binding protein
MTLEVAVRKRFPGFELDAAFTVDAPGITALFGPSGSGKTTCVDLVAGLARPDSGRIAIGGRVLYDAGRGVDVPAHRRRIGYVFQDARLFPHLNVRANLLYGARRAPAPPAPARIDGIVALLGLAPLLDRRPARLSGGERQRVALGRAILSAPEALLLDEPLAALDPARKGEIIPYLQRLRDEAAVPIVYVSHAIEEMTRLADRVVVLNRGRVAAEGTVFDMMARLDLFPMTGRFEAGAVIAATVAGHDPGDHLSEVAFDGGRLWVPAVAAPPGAAIRVRIRARDVMLALDEPSGISANNVLRGTVAEVRSDAGAYVDVRVACGGTPLIARITHRSLRRLGLAPGRPVYAVIKTVSVDQRTPVPDGEA